MCLSVSMKPLDRMPPDLDDTELVERIATASGGSSEAEAELVRRFSPRVRLYGRRHLGPQAAADLVQEVMVAVIAAARAGRVESPERVRQFILGTSRFIAWKMRRGERRRRESAEHDLAETPAGATTPAPDAGIDGQQLERCLGGLSPRERKVLYLSFSEDRTAPEIAAALELSESNVRVIRHRALGRLRVCLGQGDAGEGDTP
jgi:RNA polymerase sigma-70 factor, ECF subfamily